MPKPARKSAAAKKPAAIVAPQVMNAALPTSTGGVRVSPTWQPWSSKRLESMSRNRDLVQVSRFLQEKIPQLSYCIQQLPREAIGKGIGLKSISANKDFRRDATKLFQAWADSRAVDIRKENTFYQLQPRWLSAILGEGECFTQKISAAFEGALEWSLNDKNRRRLQLQTILRDQLTNGTVSGKDTQLNRWMDGLKFNAFDQLELIRVNQDDSLLGSTKFTDISAANVFHLVHKDRFNQYHGNPWIFRSNEDLLDVLDLKAIRKHSAKIRAALLGATVTRDGNAPNAIQAAMASEKTGTPATDTGRRFMEISEGAVMIPLANGETMNFFQGGEAIPFKDILEQLIHPFVFGLGYPVEWIFGMGNLGGTAYRGLIEKVRRAHQNLRQILHPFLQWSWEWIISDAMLPGGPLAQYAQVDDWNAIDFIADPDPSVDLGRDHKADMDRLDENLLTVEDYIESRTGGSGEAVRYAAIDEKLDSLRYAIAQATGTPKEKVVIPASLAALLAIPSRKLQAAAGIVPSLMPETIAQDLKAMD